MRSLAEPPAESRHKHRLRAEGAWRLATLLAMTAMAAALLLSGVSAWFLGAVALAGAGPVALTFNFHVPAAFVRLFALSRTAAKYGERIVGHKAALLDQVARRSALFSAMAAAPRVRRAAWQLGDQDRLSDFMDDVEDVDYARLRAGLPVLSAGAAFGALGLATLALAPMALLPVALLAMAVAGLVRRFLPRAAAARDAARSRRRDASRHFGAALAAVVPLQGERAWPNVLDDAISPLAAADAHELQSKRELALLDCVAGMFGPAAALSVLCLAWLAGDRGAALLPAAFLAFAWLALGESMSGVSRILVARVREQAAKQGIAEWTAGAGSVDTAGSPARGAPAVLQLIRVAPRAPDGRRIGGPIDLVLQRGAPTMLAGPSGCGKTSLMKQVAGWLDVDPPGQIRGDSIALDGMERQAIVHLGLHDAAILADTVRENLLAPEATDAECHAAIEAVELDARVQAAGGLDGWLTQDMLSLGEAQRLNLARALLCRSPVVLLDEPTEHLAADQAIRIMDRILARLDDRILVFSSHERALPRSAREVRTVRLGAGAGSSQRCAALSSSPRPSP